MGDTATKLSTRKIRGLSLSVPNFIGGYELVRELGRGSTGVVFECVARKTGHRVALKIMLPEVDLPEPLRRLGFTPEHFFNEARIAAPIRHPNIMRILEKGTWKGLCYIVLELVKDARALGEFLRPEQRLPFQQVLDVIIRAALALDHVHNIGILHRDVKPGNILLTTDGKVKICDFSIAAEVGRPGLAESESIGSPRYMAPEQLLRRNVDRRSEVFSLGLVLYELLTLHHPFEADDLKTLARRTLREDPQPLLQHESGLPKELEAVVTRALAKNPARRYASARELAQAVGQILGRVQQREADALLRRHSGELQALEFFREFTGQEAGAVAKLGTWREYSAGIEVVREDSAGQILYFLLSGRAGIYKGSIQFEQLSQGDCFGEMGFLANAKRTASVITEQPIRVVMFGPLEKTSLSTETLLKFYRSLNRVLLRRIHQNNRISGGPAPSENGTDDVPADVRHTVTTLTGRPDQAIMFASLEKIRISKGVQLKFHRSFARILVQHLGKSTRQLVGGDP